MIAVFAAIAPIPMCVANHLRHLSSSLRTYHIRCDPPRQQGTAPSRRHRPEPQSGRDPELSRVWRPRWSADSKRSTDGFGTYEF
jgi:hypothetical protein